MLLIGVADTLSTLTKSYAGLVVYMLIFGVFDGCFVVFLAVLCADIVGVDKVAAGIGIQFFFMAITSIAGPPLAGKAIISLFSYFNYPPVKGLRRNH